MLLRSLTNRELIYGKGSDRLSTGLHNLIQLYQKQVKILHTIKTRVATSYRTVAENDSLLLTKGYQTINDFIFNHKINQWNDWLGEIERHRIVLANRRVRLYQKIRLKEARLRKHKQRIKKREERKKLWLYHKQLQYQQQLLLNDEDDSDSSEEGEEEGDINGEGGGEEFNEIDALRSLAFQSTANASREKKKRKNLDSQDALLDL